MKFKHYLISMLACAAAVVACEEKEPAPAPVEPALEVNPFVLSVAETADEATFTIQTNQDWTAASDQTWATLDLTSGVASEEAYTVKVTVAENPDEAERTVTITVKAGELTKTVKVNQAAKVVLENGTQEKPWLIKTADDLKAMKDKTVLNGETFFKLEADIDMTGVTDYVPVNVNGEEKFNRKIYFDGGNHTISNFTCSAEQYPSLFGVLYGTVKDLKVTGAKINSTTPCGIIAGFAGTFQDDTAMPAVLENVSVQGEITSASDKNGGIAGVGYHATFTNCTADVKMAVSNTDAGGFCGKTQGDCVFTGCKVKADITSTAVAKNRVGGFIGWNATASTTMTDCQVLEGTKLTDDSQRTSAGNGNYGGLIGFGDVEGTVLKISKCTTNVAVNAGTLATYNSAFIGGTGYVSTTEITDCHAAGSVISGNYGAGLVGAVQSNAVVTRCGSTASVETNGQRCGGLLGSVTKPITVIDCYATGNVSGTGQQIGGLIGFIQGTSVVKNCYASGNVLSTKAGTAGLIGTINNGEGSEVSACIVWNKDVICERTALDVWAPGAVIGASNQAGTFKACYRRADMNFKDMEGGITLVDHEDIINAAPPQPEYAASLTKNQTAQQAYHGKAAAADATASSIAKTLGWDEAVWDLSKDLPTLK